MKPLPLLITLAVMALLGAILLISQRSGDESSGNSQLTPIPEAPLPIDYVEPELPIVQPPLLEEDLLPAPDLIAFVENHLSLQFAQPPIFTPVPAEELIRTVEQAYATFLPAKEAENLNLTAQRLGVLPDFQQLNETVITILAGEVRGLITPTRNLILHDFQPSSPPEQAALVNLLAQKLLVQEVPFPAEGATIDTLIARQYLVQGLALATEREFRKTLPEYPPSLHENIRESILLGLPSFFHELSTFAEFHLLEKLQATEPKEALTFLTAQSPLSSRALLAFPFEPKPSAQSATLGAIPFYVILLEATDPTTARTLATTLVADRTDWQDDTLRWTLTFATPRSAPKAEQFLRSYYSLRDAERKISLEVDDGNIIVTCRP